MSGLRITRFGSDRLGEVEPLWKSMHAHHARVAPAVGMFGPLDDPDVLWRRRRALYSEWLCEPGAFGLLACRDGSPVGYAVVRVRRPKRVWEPDDAVGVVESLAVAEPARGAGIGAQLLAAVTAQMRAAGIRCVELSVLAGNDGAVRFYERGGFRPSLLTLHLPLEDPGQT